jgi:hypothetical protein
VGAAVACASIIVGATEACASIIVVGLIVFGMVVCVAGTKNVRKMENHTAYYYQG